VLMDIQLPGINGYEVTKLIKAHNKNIPIIAQTAYALSGEKEHSIKEGCDDYIAKPIKKENLIDLLSQYL
ncbi:MAG: response regulator, partial [Bacteroidales bacterium]